MAQCPACQQQFSCGAGQHADQPCWCSLLPPLANAGPAATECYCPDCLERLVLQQQTVGEHPIAKDQRSCVLPGQENPA
ncbi:Cysteine-rich CWC [Collimonas sp. OK607]|uniref:cysteine-rich CWC family protein n=1 Tax=Collimonas sp. OK607 TaxID=1798194 RepID=UPI0008E9DB85|nr:cysteine-rich CWC family protein [Collimonas sp. OK607]SFB30001.1 Cysteine-rich CWC [Collimonas sp. OK607]